MKKELTIKALISEAKAFCEAESKINNAFLYGVTDGKAVGTHIEAKFKQHLFQIYNTEKGNAASGIDFFMNPPGFRFGFLASLFEGRPDSLPLIPLTLNFGSARRARRTD